MHKNQILVAAILFSAVIVKSDMGGFDGVLETKSVYNIVQDKATSGGTITLIETDLDVTEHCIVWHTSSNPTIATKTGITELGAGPESGDTEPFTFTSQMSGLTYGQTYYVRAYIINGDGDFYGDEVSFVSVPTLGEWGMIALATLLAGFGGWFVWRRVV